ncbi:MAG: HAD family hydrolase [Dorea sp.]|jgi:phosphoglycolate phosphatase|nr:HAD family hydrolase [Dorea sp.]
MIRACIFDLDGTLTDTIESLTYSVGETLKEMGLPVITKEECRSFVGNGARFLMDKSIRAAGDEKGMRLEEAMEIYGRIFDKNCTYHVVPYEGILELLEELRKRKVKLAVLSNKPHRQTVKVAERILGKGIFETVCGQQEGVLRKPSPEGIYTILKELKVEKEECLYVGDSEVDIITGKNAGMKTVSVTWGFRTEEELKSSGASYLIQRPEELLGLL